MTGERIFVIGSKSFTGASFIDFALNSGFDIVGSSRSAPPARPFLPYTWKGDVPSERFMFAQLDLNADTAGIVERIADFRPRYVFNFAAQSMVAQSWLYPEHCD